MVVEAPNFEALPEDRDSLKVEEYDEGALSLPELRRRAIIEDHLRKKEEDLYDLYWNELGELVPRDFEVALNPSPEAPVIQDTHEIPSTADSYVRPGNLPPRTQSTEYYSQAASMEIPHDEKSAYRRMHDRFSRYRGARRARKEARRERKERAGEITQQEAFFLYGPAGAAAVYAIYGRYQ